MAEQRKIDDYLFYCGTSNVELPVPNKLHFPPEYQDKSRLNYYASLYNSVEINSTFYKLPMPRTVEKWANDVPEDFRFTFKLWKSITHVKELDFDAEDIQKFMAAVNACGTKKGCILIQFPGSIKAFYFPKFKCLIDELYKTSAGQGWRLAVEFRDKSWYRDATYQLLESYKATIVTHDIPASATPLIDMESDFVYLRFHGEKGDYRGSYEDEYLEEQASYIREWTNEGKQVFAYFNNTIGQAVQNAELLNHYYSQMET